jgi:hypothetical protein
VAASAASPLGVLGSGALAAYWRFHAAVAAAQLAAWLPPEQSLIVDISGPRSGSAAQAAAAGHNVVRLSWAGAAAPAPWPQPRAGRGRLVTVAAETGSLSCLADGCADRVIADDATLSRQLMAEDLAGEIARVLRPGGAVLASVDSLVLGMAIMAEQHRWAHLADLPHAEVVLVPWPDGTITRCFGATQLRDLLAEAGLQPCWIRPRTVLSPSAVDHVLRREPGAIGRLVRAELAAETAAPGSGERDDSFGIHLLAAARKPP